MNGTLQRHSLKYGFADLASTTISITTTITITITILAAIYGNYFDHDSLNLAYSSASTDATRIDSNNTNNTTNTTNTDTNTYSNPISTTTNIPTNYATNGTTNGGISTTTINDVNPTLSNYLSNNTTDLDYGGYNNDLPSLAGAPDLEYLNYQHALLNGDINSNYISRLLVILNTVEKLEVINIGNGLKGMINWLLTGPASQYTNIMMEVAKWEPGHTPPTRVMEALHFISMNGNSQSSDKIKYMINIVNNNESYNDNIKPYYYKNQPLWWYDNENNNMNGANSHSHSQQSIKSPMIGPEITGIKDIIHKYIG